MHETATLMLEAQQIGINLNNFVCRKNIRAEVKRSLNLYNSKYTKYTDSDIHNIKIHLMQ